MDPLSQGLLGAALPLAVTKDKENIRTAAWVGLLGGMAPDIDIFIRSAADPLMAIQFHRHFTHSLFFIPIGGIIVGSLLWLITGRRHDLRQFLTWATLGYATHALLDACTSYGTQLLWPFSGMRVSWNNVGVVDLFLTFPLGVLCLVAWKKRRALFAALGLAWVVFYLLLGVVQRERAEYLLQQHADASGHNVERLTARPTLFNPLLYRGIYQSEGRYYIRGLYLGPLGRTRIYDGDVVEMFEVAELNLDPSSVLAKDIQRFAKFSDNWLSWHPNHEGILGDVRYAMLPNKNAPLWGITVDLNKPDAHTPFTNFREGAREKLPIFLKMVKGQAIDP